MSSSPSSPPSGEGEQSEKSLVLLYKTSCPPPFHPLTLPHPRTGSPVTFYVRPDGTLHELNSIAPLTVNNKCIASFFSNNHVISDGNVYMMTKLNRVLVLLPMVRRSLSKNFGPFEDFVQFVKGSEGCDDVKERHEWLTPENLRACCKVLENGGEDYFKYDEEKTMSYLVGIYDRIESVLKGKSDKENDVGGSPIESENKPKADNTSGSSVGKSSRASSNVREIAALHLCEYLAKDLSKSLLERLQISQTVLESKKRDSTSSKADEYHGYAQGGALPGGEGDASAKKKQKKEDSKKKEKMDKLSKGTKSMFSFFTKKPPKTNK